MRKVSSNTLQAAGEALSAAAKKEKKEVSKSAAIAALKSRIRAARARGLSWAEIREVLASAGVAVSVPTLSRAAGVAEKPRAAKVKAKAVPVAAAQEVAMAPRLPAGHFQVRPDRDL